MSITAHSNKESRLLMEVEWTANIARELLHSDGRLLLKGNLWPPSEIHGYERLRMGEIHDIKVSVYFDIPRFSILVPLFIFIAFPVFISSPLSS